MRGKKQIGYLAIVLCAGIIGLGYMEINKGHRNISNEIPILQISAQNLFLAFHQKNENKYLDKVLEVSGTVTESTESTVTLDGKIQIALLNPTALKTKKEDNLTVKGRCIGYDDLLEIVKIDQATITK